MRERAYRRKMDYHKALRKKHLSDSWLLNRTNGQSWYTDLHRYSKNKAFCSCGMCSRYTKTNNSTARRRKIHGNYAPSYNPSTRDRRRLDSMNWDEQSYFC